MSAPTPVIRPVVPGTSDLTAVTAIMEHYVEHTVATFNEIPPSAEDWARLVRALTGGLDDRLIRYVTVEPAGTPTT